MLKEQLPNQNQKKIDFVGLYFLADNLLTDLKTTIMDYKDGGLSAINQINNLNKIVEDQKEEIKCLEGQIKDLKKDCLKTMGDSKKK